MARLDVLVANVAEAGDIVLLGIVLLMTVVVGTALLALDTVVGRLHAKRESNAPTSRGGDPAKGRGGA